jgi:hypothetical protein
VIIIQGDNALPYDGVPVDINLSTGLLIGATVANGIAAGVALDLAIKQLPARQRIGPAPYRDYACAADLGNGLAWYPVLEASTTLVTTGAVVTGLLDRPGTTRTIALLTSAASTLTHLVATARAAPMLLSLRRGDPDHASIATTLDRFARIHAVRTAAIVTTLAALTWALATNESPRVR